MADMNAFRDELRRQAEDLASRVMASDTGQRLIGWYDGLGDRDRLALRLLSCFLAGVMLYFAAVSPLLAYVGKAERRLEDERALLAWLRSHEGEAGAGPVVGGIARNQPVATLVNTSAKESGLTIRRYEPADNDGMRVWLEDVPFNAVIKWIVMLEGNYGIRAVEFNVEREGAAGRVSARLTLRG
jgi:general secretion pathway protein M